MLQALEVAKVKLSEYYAQTDSPKLGNLYAHGTILAPQHKLHFFKTADWQDHDYATQYEISLKDRIKSYQSKSTSHTSIPSITLQRSELESLLTPEVECPFVQDELSHYLQSGISPFYPLLPSFTLFFWPKKLIIYIFRHNPSEYSTILERKRDQIPNSCANCAWYLLYPRYRCWGRKAF